MLVKKGDRGSSVLQVQMLLNVAPTRLARLAVDGIFGPLTHARVLEFQKDNRLKVDGLVGPATMAALQRKKQRDEQFIADLLRLAAFAGRGLSGLGLGYFSTRQRALLGPFTAATPVTLGIRGAPTTASFAVPWQLVFQLTPQGQIFMALLLLMYLLVALMLMSNNPATRQRARFWEKEIEKLEAGAEGGQNPTEAARQAAAKAKQQAREFIDSKTEAIERCKGNNQTPSKECAAALAEISRVMAELEQKLRLGFDSFTSIAAGIARNMGELIAALRDAAIHCKGCGDLI